MKKKCIALGALLFTFGSAFADDNVLVETASSISTKSSGELAADSVVWTFPGTAGLNANQAFFNDYCTDGTGASISLDAFLNLNANYTKNRVKWENGFAAKYGFIYSTEFLGDDLVRKNMDEFNLSSKFGYKMSKYWYLSALANLESQFTTSYKYEPDVAGIDSASAISDFFAPGYLKVSLGFDYVPNKYISLFMSPMTARFTFCRVNELAPNYGMDLVEEATYDSFGTLISEPQYEKSRSELGAYAILRSDFDITKSLHFFSSLEGFYAYNKAVTTYTDTYVDWYGQYYEFESFDPEAYETMFAGQDMKKNIHGWYVKWKLELMLKVSKYVNLSFKTQLKYDNAEMKTIEDKNYGLPQAKLQFWETTSLGVAFKF